jgi:uncharacterized OsmC-like protein
MPERKSINGLNVEGWFKAIETIKGNPGLARFTFRAKNRWVGGVHCRTFIKDFHGLDREDESREEAFILDADEPRVLLGEDHGPNATEALLHALATCLNTTFMYHASAHGVEVEELDLELSGNLDLRGVMGISGEVRNGFEEIRVTFRVKADAPREQIEKLCQLAQQRSPVFDMVSHGVPVRARLE